MDLIRQLDSASPIPLYRQLALQIRRLVDLRALRGGERLPTVRELAVLARVNRNTAARAVRELEADGVVETRVGRGTFVASNARARGQDPRLAAIDETLDRVVALAREAGLRPQTAAERLLARFHAAPFEEDTE